MPQHLLVANWKMNLGARESRELAQAIVKSSATLQKTAVWLAPSIPNIYAAVEACRESQVQVGSQNVHWADKGAYTGEVSPVTLLEAGCTFSIVGHSERRHEFGEEPDMCAKRALGALAHGLKVIFCIGETINERGYIRAALDAQLSPFLKSLPAQNRNRVTLAYEPVWAIGTGLAAKEKDIEETHAMIEAICAAKLSGAALPILYGGSVTVKNFKDIIRTPHVAGTLVGGASLIAKDFSEMIAESEKA